MPPSHEVRRRFHWEETMPLSWRKRSSRPAIPSSCGGCYSGSKHGELTVAEVLIRLSNAGGGVLGSGLHSHGMPAAPHTLESSGLSG
jgi:hypothetical protein